MGLQLHASGIMCKQRSKNRLVMVPDLDNREAGAYAGRHRMGHGQPALLGRCLCSGKRCLPLGDVNMPGTQLPPQLGKLARLTSQILPTGVFLLCMACDCVIGGFQCRIAMKQPAQWDVHLGWSHSIIVALSTQSEGGTTRGRLPLSTPLSSAANAAARVSSSSAFCPNSCCCPSTAAFQASAGSHADHRHSRSPNY